MIDKELISQMLNRMDKITDQQTEILVKQSELASEQRHTTETTSAIKEDVAEIKEVQSQHSADIADIKNKLVNHIETEESELSFKEYAKQFAMNHPLIVVAVVLMLINVILGSIGLPLINVLSIWTILVSGVS